MNHTKRSPEFADEVNALVLMLLDGHRVLRSDDCARIAEILQRNTTDSPCLVNAANDEPIFVLKANDELAPHIVGDWAGQYLRSKTQIDRGASPSDIDKAIVKHGDAWHCAREMERWKLEQVKQEQARRREQGR